jgi:hypothetical protein
MERKRSGFYLLSSPFLDSYVRMAIPESSFCLGRSVSYPLKPGRNFLQGSLMSYPLSMLVGALRAGLNQQPSRDSLFTRHSVSIDRSQLARGHTRLSFREVDGIHILPARCQGTVGEVFWSLMNGTRSEPHKKRVAQTSSKGQTLI